MNTYPPNWDEIALACKVAVGWRCVRCKHWDDPAECKRLEVRRGLLPCDENCMHMNLISDNPNPDPQRVLTVHHLDGDKANCLWWNLAPLCQVCHLRIQAKIKMQQHFLFPTLHRAWFQPYLIGAMQFTSLKEGMHESYQQIILRLEVQGLDLWPHPFTTKR